MAVLPQFQSSSALTLCVARVQQAERPTVVDELTRQIAQLPLQWQQAKRVEEWQATTPSEEPMDYFEWCSNVCCVICCFTRLKDCGSGHDRVMLFQKGNELLTPVRLCTLGYGYVDPRRTLMKVLFVTEPCVFVW